MLGDDNIVLGTPPPKGGGSPDQDEIIKAISMKQVIQWDLQQVLKY